MAANVRKCTSVRESPPSRRSTFSGSSVLELGYPCLYEKVGDCVHRLLRAVIHGLLEVGPVEHGPHVDTHRLVLSGVVAHCIRQRLEVRVEAAERRRAE